MRFLYRLLGLLYCLPIVVSTLQALPYPYWKDSHQTLPVHPKALWKELDNGLSYVIIPCQEPPQKVSLKLYVATGSAMEEDKEQGLAHFLEHLVFRGSEHFPEGTVKALQEIGSALGPHINACTSFFETIYQLDIPDNDAHTLRTALLAMQDYAFGASLTEDIVNSERKVVLAEEKASDTVNFRSRKRLISFLTEGCLLPKRLPIGKVPELKALRAEDIQHFYKKWYQPQRMVLVVAGDIQPEALSRQIQEIFGPFPRGENSSSPDIGKVNPRKRAVYVHQDAELTQTELILTVLKPHAFSPYDAEAFRQDLYESLLNDILQTRLQKAQKQAGSTFSLSGISSTVVENCVKVNMASIQVMPGQWKPALELLQQELQSLVTHGITATELEQSTKRMLRQLEEAIKAEKTYSSGDWCRAVISSISAKKPLISAELALDLAKNGLSTFSPEDALPILQSMWTQGDTLIAISTPESIPEKSVLAYYEKNLSTPVVAKVESALSSFEYTPYTKPGTLKNKKHIKDLDIHTLEFANNVQAKLKITDFEAETVYIQMRFGGGLLDEPKEQRGLGLLADLAFLQGGLGKHSADDLHELLSGKLIKLSFSVGQDAFYLSATCSKRDVEDALVLLLAYMTDPGYRPEALAEAHKALEPLYKHSTQTPEGVFANRGQQFLASGDERFALPEYDKCMKLSLADIQAWLDKLLKKSVLELSIVGDTDLEALLQSLSHTFGALPSRDKTKPSYSAARKVSFPVSSKRAELPFKSELKRAVVSVSWPTSDGRKAKKARRLAILAEIFRNEMLKRLREEEGLSYSPSAKSHTSVIFNDYGYFMAGTLADTKHIQRIAQSILKIAEDLATEGISQEAFNLAMQPILKNLKNDLRDNQYWMQVLSGSQERPIQLDWARDRSKDIASIQPKEIQDLAKKYLNPNKALQLFVIPRKFEDSSAK